MHILYLHQHFALPTGSTGTRSYEMARRWVAAGHDVTLICGRGDICGLPEQKQFEIEGIRVRVVGSAYSQKQSFFQRLAVFFNFMIICTFEGLRVHAVDVIYATSTPLTIGIPAMLLKWLKCVPFVFEVRDQWPEVPIEMGIIRNPFLKWFLLWLERQIYKSSAAVVALSPGMAEGVRTVLNEIERPVIVAPNSADTELFHPDIDSAGIRQEMGWNNKFVILHFGAMGRVNGLSFLIEAAQKTRNIPDIIFVMIGEGRERKNLAEKAAKLNLNNYQIHGPVKKKDMPGLVGACDVSTVIIGKYPIIEHNSANKFFDSLAAGKPVLLNYSGWQRDILEINKSGFGCQLTDLEEYVERVKYLHRNAEKCAQMGKNARKLAESEFNRDQIAFKVLETIIGASQNDRNT